MGIKKSEKKNIEAETCVVLSMHTLTNFTNQTLILIRSIITELIILFIFIVVNVLKLNRCYKSGKTEKLTMIFKIHFLEYLLASAVSKLRPSHLHTKNAHIFLPFGWARRPLSCLPFSSTLSQLPVSPYTASQTPKSLGAFLAYWHITLSPAKREITNSVRGFTLLFFSWMNYEKQ